MKKIVPSLAACFLAGGLILSQSACERLDPHVIFPEYMAKKAAAEKKEESEPSAGERSSPTFFQGQSIQ
jgi:hypothetical protein